MTKRRPGARSRHIWTMHEDALIRDAYLGGRGAVTLAERLGVTQSALHQRAFALGIKHRRWNRTLAERFWDFVYPEPNTGCWLWGGSVDSSGYGVLRVGGLGKRATHLSLELHGIKRGAGLHALHRCDMPPCVNPEHLFVGTHKDNMRDRAAKGRSKFQQRRAVA